MEAVNNVNIKQLATKPQKEKNVRQWLLTQGER